MEYVRTIEDIESVIGHAKLEVNELRPLTQVLYFTDEDSDYRILELNKELHDSLIVKKEELIFKGDPDEKAVICTSDSTYDVKSAETSNSLLFIPGLKFTEEVPLKSDQTSLENKTIVAVMNEYLEVKKCRPRLQKLKRLLDENPYAGPENENLSNNLYTTDDLLETVQASRLELIDALKDIDAIDLDEKWRIMSPEYHFRTLSYLLNLIDENSWPPDSIPLGQTIDTLKDLIPKPILHHLIEAYLEPSGGTDDEGDELFVLKGDKTCRFVGECLLRQGVKLERDDFMEAWSASVPEGLEINPKQLQGLALITTENNSSVVNYFPESELPENETERFEKLFAKKSHWTFEEIEPYVKKLVEKQSVNSLIMKFCRMSNVNGIKMYSARHGK